MVLTYEGRKNQLEMEECGLAAAPRGAFGAESYKTEILLP
jgi:hypothetical protein